MDSFPEKFNINRFRSLYGQVMPKNRTMQHHLSYIGIVPSDVNCLRAIRTVIETNSSMFIDRFYDHLKAFEGTRVFLADQAVLNRLLSAQRTYLLSLFDAQFDEAYYQHRRVIGQTHFRIGLDFHWYIGAYAIYLELLQGLIWKNYEFSDPRIPATLNAVHKAVLLDMTIVMEAYHDEDKAALKAAQGKVIHQEKLATVGLLTSGLAHEIGNPLASILAICDNQLRKKDTDTVSLERFERIKQLVLRVSGIVRQLVTHSKPDPALWEYVQVNDVIKSSIDVARLARTSKTVEIKLTLASEVPEIFAIPDQLAQVFLNLILNAFDAMPTVGGILSLHTTWQNQWVRVSVHDNGSGIPEANQAKLFAPFFTTKDVGQGTGLGLHVSLGIVQSHGGEIQVQSSLGQGSMFTVLLPLRDRPPALGIRP